MVEVRNLRKRFGPVTAVDGVSFAAADGEITGLLGENGAGKTTTLAMIGGVLKPDAGSVHFDGADAKAMLNGRQHMGALLDHKGLYSRLTARENIRYFGELHGLTAPELDERVSRTLALLKLDALADRRAAGFSQGERMKVALGRAVVHGPRNLLLDEPTNGLDIPARCAPCAAGSGTCAIAGSVSSFPAMCWTKCGLCAVELSSSPRAASWRTARLTRSAATVVASRWRMHSCGSSHLRRHSRDSSEPHRRAQGDRGSSPGPPVADVRSALHLDGPARRDGRVIFGPGWRQACSPAQHAVRFRTRVRLHRRDGRGDGHHGR